MDQVLEDAEFSFLSAAWFAVTSCIPVIFVFWLFSDVTLERMLRLGLFGVLPVSIASVCGFSSGASILDPNHVKTSRQAFVQGIKVALWSYAFFAVISVTGLTFYFSIFERSSDQPFALEFIAIFFEGFYIALIGLIVVGWLLVIGGAIAGWLLFRYRLRFRSSDDAA